MNFAQSCKVHRRGKSVEMHFENVAVKDMTMQNEWRKEEFRRNGIKTGGVTEGRSQRLSGLTSHLNIDQSWAGEILAAPDIYSFLRHLCRS